MAVERGAQWKEHSIRAKLVIESAASPSGAKRKICLVIAAVTHVWLSLKGFFLLFFCNK